MSVISTQDVRDLLEGYCITTTIVSDIWLQKRIDNFIVPMVEKRFLQAPLENEIERTVYLSGTCKSILILPDRPINEIVSIDYVTGQDVDSSISLGGIEVIAEEGIIKSVSNITEGRYNSVFVKGDRNIKVVYKVGFSTVPNEILEAITYLAAEQTLGFLGSRTGGGDLNVQGWGRGYGERGKYTHIRNDLKRQAMIIFKDYMTTVTGSIS